jgi:hypothetical protein
MIQDEDKPARTRHGPAIVKPIIAGNVRPVSHGPPTSPRQRDWRRCQLRTCQSRRKPGLGNPRPRVVPSDFRTRGAETRLRDEGPACSHCARACCS